MTEPCIKADYIEARLTGIERAVEVANGEMDRRLTGMNEFRDALRDQAARLTTREELRLSIGPIVEDIRMLRDFKSTMEGKASQSAVNMATFIALTGFMMGIIGIILTIWK